MKVSRKTAGLASLDSGSKTPRSTGRRTLTGKEFVKICSGGKCPLRLVLSDALRFWHTRDDRREPFSVTEGGPWSITLNATDSGMGSTNCGWLLPMTSAVSNFWHPRAVVRPVKPA